MNGEKTCGDCNHFFDDGGIDENFDVIIETHCDLEIKLVDYESYICKKFKEEENENERVTKV